MTANSPAAPLIAIERAAFGYGGQAVIQNVSLEVAAGEFIGLVGPNGAGKSTLFKGLLGLLPPLAGHVHHAAALAQRIGYVPQRDRLEAIYPLTARDVVSMTSRTRTDESLTQVGMADFADHPFATLSGGQRQRVLIARAIALDPLLLVLDEPTAGVDPEAEEAILELLSHLHARSQMSILMVSHHRDSLKERADRILTVENGGVHI